MIRKQAGIEFPGWEASYSSIIAEATLAEPTWGIRRDAQGINAIGKLADGKRAGIVVREQHAGEGRGDVSIDDLREALVAVWGSDFGVHDVTWLSRFTDMTRQAASYRDRRMMLAGDAAHVHSPAGGQGLNLGVQDAVNLGWKLARVAHGTSPVRLLETYQAERHPAVARVLKNTMAATALSRSEARIEALFATMSELLKLDGPRKHIAALLSGLDVHYDLGEGHPLLGRRMPDLDLITTEGPQRVFRTLHAAQPVLIDFGESIVTDRVRVIRATYAGAWELPVIGAVAAPTAVLIRPDGYVAWVGEGTDARLADALTTWF